MKKLISCILIATYILSFRVTSIQAAAPALGLVGVAAIGATVLAIGGTQYALKEGGAVSFDGARLRRDMIAYAPSSVAKLAIDQYAAAKGLAGSHFLGKSVQAIFDIENAFNDKIMQSYSALDNFVRQYFSNLPSESAPPEGAIISTPIGNRLVGPPETARINWNYLYGTSSHYFYGPFTFYASNGWLYHVPEDRYPNAEPYETRYYGVKYPTTATDLPSSYPSNTPPPVLPVDRVAPISEALVSAAADPSVRDDLDRLMKDHPELWAFPDTASLPEHYPPNTPISDYPPAWPITPSQIQQWASTNAIAAQQALVDDLQTKVDANPNDLGLQTSLSQAKSKLDQMQATSVGDLSQSEQLEAEKAKDLEISEPSIPELEVKSISLDPIKATQGVMMHKFPFSILTSAGNFFSVLVADPIAPSFEIDLGLGAILVDLGVFDGFASNIRGVMSFLIFGLTAYVCLRIWSRF